ncbi:hypothetical protein [Streptomyces sp. KS 21]|nr:hypothetical protein [Streptomyces sp. KS 21]
MVTAGLAVLTALVVVVVVLQGWWSSAISAGPGSRPLNGAQL